MCFSSVAMVVVDLCYRCSRREVWDDIESALERMIAWQKSGGVNLWSRNPSRRRGSTVGGVIITGSSFYTVSVVAGPVAIGESTLMRLSLVGLMVSVVYIRYIIYNGGMVRDEARGLQVEIQRSRSSVLVVVWGGGDYLQERSGQERSGQYTRSVSVHHQELAGDKFWYGAILLSPTNVWHPHRPLI